MTLNCASRHARDLFTQAACRPWDKIGRRERLLRVTGLALYDSKHQLAVRCCRSSQHTEGRSITYPRAMARLVAPPGHPAQPLALITASFGDMKLSVDAPDADLKARCGRCVPPVAPSTAWRPARLAAGRCSPQGPVLTTDAGDKIASSADIARYGAPQLPLRTRALVPPPNAHAPSPHPPAPLCCAQWPRRLAAAQLYTPPPRPRWSMTGWLWLPRWTAPPPPGWSRAAAPPALSSAQRRSAASRACSTASTAS